MNKFTKSVLALGLALSILAGVGGVSVFAKSFEKGQVNGVNCRGGSSIAATSASAYTSYDTNGTVTVSSTYKYVRISDLKGTTEKRTNGHYNYTSNNFSVSNSHRSVYISSNHKVSISGQSWSATTSATIG